MRAFVIGNGPSLKETPLDLLKGEYTIALNRIHLIFPFTSWRPTVYVKTDHNPHLLDVWIEETRYNVREAQRSYLWDRMRDGYTPDCIYYKRMPEGMGETDKVTWIPRCKHHYYHHDNYIHKAQSWHLPEICTAFSGISPAIQIAVLEGATEIYLVGCDVGYGRPKGQDHFDPSYSWDTHSLGTWDTNEVMEAHQLAWRCCPVPIKNATIGGKLEIYPRLDLRKVLEDV